MIPGVLDQRTELSVPETRAVVFLDILGFKHLTDELIDRPEEMNRLDQILLFAQRLLTGDLGIAKDCDVRMFSDCLCVSSPALANGLVRLVATLEHLQLQLAMHGVFLRGAVTIGQHFQTPRMIMSQALIAAYELESRIAVFPRIVVDAPMLSALSQLSPNQWDNPWSSVRRVQHSLELHIREDPRNAVPYLHYMADLHSVDSGPLFHHYVMEHKRAVQQWVRRGLSLGLPAEVRSKYRWLIDYHNVSVREVADGCWLDEYGIADDILVG